MGQKKPQSAAVITNMGFGARQMQLHHFLAAEPLNNLS